MVDLSESGDPLNDINALAEVCEPGTVVIATGQVNDVRLYRDLVASGIHDYLLKPLNPDALRDTFAQAQMALNAPKLAETASDPGARLLVVELEALGRAAVHALTAKLLNQGGATVGGSAVNVHAVHDGERRWCG